MILGWTVGGSVLMVFSTVTVNVPINTQFQLISAVICTAMQQVKPVT